jgi:tRNA(Ile)-lysidine synthase
MPAPSLPAPTVAVAVSGGRDSTALLHATARAARPAGLQVVALHVHHGLNPSADDWLRHLQRQCARWARGGLPLRLVWQRLSGSPARRESVEAWARRERYRALAEMARGAGADLVLLAHHRQDQAETFVLQALRGAGPAGLAAMPKQAWRDGITWCRPWLDQPPRAIEAYIARHRLSHIEDDSNQDRRFDRNRLRLDVWPVLRTAFPQAEATLVQAARQSQWADALVDEVAAADLQQCTVDGAPDTLVLRPWLSLTPARRRAALRAWLMRVLPGAVPDSLLNRLTAELPGRTVGRWPVDRWCELQLYRGRLSRAPSAVAANLSRDDARACPAAAVRLDRPGRIVLPAWGGCLALEAVGKGGIALSRLARAQLRDRAAADRFQFAPRSTPRSLKKQFQARSVPMWQRQGPIIACGEQVLYVPGLGVDARARALDGEPQLLPHWCPGN